MAPLTTALAAALLVALAVIAHLVRRLQSAAVREARLTTALEAERDRAAVTAQRLEKAERVADLVIDQLAAKAGLLHEHTFSASSKRPGGSGALPKLFAALGRSERIPGPSDGRGANQPTE